jgi:NADH:ubiquinone oxidoreductase subunit E
MAHVCECAQERDKIDPILERIGTDADSLIEILHAVQEEIGYLPQHVQEYVADKMDLPVGSVEGVITFYSFFTTVPRGRHTIRVCQGTACYVRGGKRVLELVSKSAGIGVGETSDDRRFSLEIVRCIGACGLAPVLTVDGDVFERVKSTRVADILDVYK